MQKFLSMLFSRRALAIVGVVCWRCWSGLLGRWWRLTPCIPRVRGKSGSHHRSVTDVPRTWLVNWSMSIIGVTVLCLVIGLFHPCCPSVMFIHLRRCGCADAYRSDPADLCSVWPVPAVRALRLDEQLLRRFLHPRGEEYLWQGKLKPTCVPSAILSAGHPATETTACGSSWLAKSPGGKRFLYELPWFMVIGSPGDGKPLRCLTPGYSFRWRSRWSNRAYPHRAGRRHAALRLVVYNEAVLIDTAGRYARHDDGGESARPSVTPGNGRGFWGCCVTPPRRTAQRRDPDAERGGSDAQSPAERLAACAALRARLADCGRRWAFVFRSIWLSPRWISAGLYGVFPWVDQSPASPGLGFTLPYSRRRHASDPQSLHASVAGNWQT